VGTHLCRWDAVDPVPDRVDDCDVDDGLRRRACQRTLLSEEEIRRVEATRVDAAVEAAPDLVVLQQGRGVEGVRASE
jgi:hypothetical protein